MIFSLSCHIFSVCKVYRLLSVPYFCLELLLLLLRISLLIPPRLPLLGLIFLLLLKRILSLFFFFTSVHDKKCFKASDMAVSVVYRKRPLEVDEDLLEFHSPSGSTSCFRDFSFMFSEISRVRYLQKSVQMMARSVDIHALQVYWLL